MQAFPSEYVQHCRAVYERCRSGRRCAYPVGDRRMSASPVDKVNIDDLIIDPHPLEYYAEALHTPAEVLAMFPDMQISRTCLFFGIPICWCITTGTSTWFCKIVVCIYYQNTYLL
ncbi:hypothetical protein Hanom_Chr09g00795631 [Helianthus anomalus]